MPTDDVLDDALRHTRAWLEELPQRPVRPLASLEELRAGLGGALPETGEPARAVVDRLVAEGTPGLVATPGPRFFGFVVGGSQPVALAADWLTSAWDQNCGLYALSPTVSVLEETAARWLAELLAVPAGTAVGFVTGAQMANFTCLAAARNAQLARAGWDVERDGLYGAPELHVVVGEEVHVTVLRALRFLGLGQARVKTVPADGQGRMDPAGLAPVLAGCRGPTVVCLQAGNVNTGSCDDFSALVPVAREHGAWVHVDGAFGLWAAATPARRALVLGAEQADSWAVDAHKWLNVPYDSGLALVRDPAVLRAAVGTQASYLVQSTTLRDGVDHVPEFSRRGRGVAVWAALRGLGRQGVAELVERCCTHARAFADGLHGREGARVLNDVVLNQVLVRFERSGDADPDARTREVIARVQADGTCWLAGSTWKGRHVMRISVSGWNTTADDVSRSVAAILRCAADV